MIAELGLFFLILALMTALLQVSILLPVTNLKICVTRCMMTASWLQALCITLAFATLITLRLDSDFSVATVIANSNVALPTLYKIVGTWGNHEGSMMLWVLVLSTFGVGVAMRPMPSNPELKITTIAVQSAICSGFLLFILFTSNPFERRFPPTVDGEALNPLLQDFALSIHPPLLYIGYVGFSIVFSFAVAALLQKRMDREWANIVHPWILASWSSLTIGIGLGSWWAYRVLGWGGFWFWDPVENASLLPWLSGTALLHSNIILRKRGILKQWVLLLAIVTFALSLLGTFLVRSGVLISVHSFASDPTRGFFILGYIAAVVGGALTLYAFRAGSIAADEPGENLLPLSREGMIVINNLFLLTACATVLLGTLYPMLMEWLSNDKITVGPAYFNATFLPLMAIPLIFAGFTPFLPWKMAEFKIAIRQARPAFMACAAVIILVSAVVKQEAMLTAFGLSLACWLTVCSVQWIKKQGTSGYSLAVFFGHIGAAFVVAGITGASLWNASADKGISIGESINIAGYTLTYDRSSTEDTDNYHANLVRLRVSDANGKDITTLTPEYRTYNIRKSTTNIADIYSTPMADLYAVIGETSGKRTAVRLYYHPLMFLVWLGCILIALGGITGIVRRLK